MRRWPSVRSGCAREDPRRRPLEDVELPDLRLESRGRTGSPMRPSRRPRRSCPSESTPWSQRAEWNTGPSKVSSPGNRRDRRLAERARRGDHDIGRDEPFEVTMRQRCVLVPGEALTAWSKRMCGRKPVMARAVPQVREDLGLRRERPAPVGVRGERERIEVRRARRRRSRDTCCRARCRPRRRPARG